MRNVATLRRGRYARRHAATRGGRRLRRPVARFVNGVWKRTLTQTAAGLLGRLGEGVQIVAIAHRAPDDFSGDMWLSLRYEVPRYALPVDGGLELRPAAVNVVKDHSALFRAGSTDWPEERLTDILLYNSQRLDVTEEITLPKGFALVGAPRFAAVAETLAISTPRPSRRGARSC